MKKNQRWHLTRRAFLANGTLQFSAMSFMPNLFGSILRSAYGQEGAPNWVPAVIIDLAGGMALPSHFLVGGKGGPTDFFIQLLQAGLEESKR